MAWTCTCDAACYGYVACSCVSTTYGCTCYSTSYCNTCGCNSSCYNQSCSSSDLCDCYTYWYCACVSTTYGCTICYSSCYGQATCVTCDYVQYGTLVVNDGFKEGESKLFDNTILRDDALEYGETPGFDNTMLMSDGVEFGDWLHDWIFMFPDGFTTSEPGKTITATIVRQDTVNFSEYKFINTFRAWVIRGIADATQWITEGVSIPGWTTVAKKIANWTKI